jgi:hypothetical protein
MFDLNPKPAAFAICAAWLALSLGCEQKAPESATQQTDAQPAQNAAPAAAAKPSPAEVAEALKDSTPARRSGDPALPPGHPPIDRAAPAPPPPAPSGALPAGHPPVGGAPADLKYDAPQEWKSVPPASGMRKAQFVLPRADGDSEDGELVVFYFGRGEGGGVAANLARWRGMFTTPEGQPIPDESAQHESFDAGGLKVSLIDVSGRYAPGTMPGGIPVEPRKNYRMLAAVVETPDGPWFFRATGPAATMAQQRDAFRVMLESVRR